MAKKILCVEDHAAQRGILAQMLEFNGFEVAEAEDGMVGVKMAQNWAPDLILMDLRLPKMDGFAAIKAIRAEETTKDIPIIAVSAWASAKHKERSLAAGADDHFTKPIDPKQLLATIRRYLDE